MTRLVCLSDTHSKHKQIEIPEGDILIHAGDLTPRGNYFEFISVGNWLKELKSRFKHIIMIAGNHDWGLQIGKPIILNCHFGEDIIYLEDEAIELEGIKFYGTPWVQQFYDWAFMKQEEDLKPIWDNIPEDTNILITHSPPFGILDKESDNARCGSPSLAERIKQLKELKYHIFGHIHEGYGSVKVNGVSYHNVASLNGEYQYQNKPQVIDY